MVNPTYRHRCYCCVGKTEHASGPCVTCGSTGYLFARAETLSDDEMVQHRRIINTNGQTCKLTQEEREMAIRFVVAGEPNTWEPEE